MSQRNYKREYALYQSSPKAIAERAERNAARAELTKRLGAAALVGKDVDHRIPLKNGGTNADSNLRVRSIASNRGDKSMMRRKLA